MHPWRRLFETVSPLLPDLVGRLSADIAPFCSVAGMAFSEGAADAAGGGWRNYFVGLVGSVAADEDDILWPNQVMLVLDLAGHHATAGGELVGLWQAPWCVPPPRGVPWCSWLAQQLCRRGWLCVAAPGTQAGRHAAVPLLGASGAGNQCAGPGP